MLIWLVTIFLAAAAGSGWLFLKRDPDRYIHEQKSPINFFFKWGRLYHHFFKIGIITLFIFGIFSIYKYLLSASDFLSIALSLLAGAFLTGGKELLDKSIELDDVISSIIGIAIGASVIFLLI